MFKALANTLHRTPWWGMVMIGFITMAALVVFTIPFQVIRLEKAGASKAENQAIKREVDAAFAGQGLNIAEDFVKAFAARTKDPVRQLELERALEEIQRAKEEIDAATRASADARREAERAARDAGSQARQAMKEAAAEARNAARESLIASREAALDGAVAALEGQKNALKALRDAGVKDSQVEGQISASIRQAEQQVAEAKRKLEAARSDKRSMGIRLNLGDDKPAFQIDLDDPPAKAALPTPPAAPVAPVAPVAPTVGKAAVPPKAPAQPPAAPSMPAAPTAPEPPEAPALPADLRADIHEKVADDFFRLTFGAILIVIFIPLFIMAIIAKFFIDRARAAQKVAEQKKEEADFHSMSRQLTEARLQALQAQVEPHFLYNTLANVQALTEVDPPLANKMVEHLIQYLRAALPKMREMSSTVGQEMELVRAYLNILQIRMGSRLVFSINVPDDVAKMHFPPLMLQTLIENAIKHGLEPQREGGRIDINASCTAGLIAIEVKDTGRGLGSGTAGSGVGLANIRERLEGLYGTEGKLTLTENTPTGVIATLQVPNAPPRLQGSTPRKEAPAQPAAPRTVQARIWGGVKTAHSVWMRIATYTFIALIGVLVVAFLIGLVGAYTGILPVEIGNARLSGVEGVAIGTLILLAAFAVLTVVALVLVALFYGLGVMAAAMLVIIPLIILVAIFPALLPFLLIGLVVWWYMRRKKKREQNALPTLEM